MRGKVANLDLQEPLQLAGRLYSSDDFSAFSGKTKQKTLPATEVIQWIESPNFQQHGLIIPTDSTTVQALNCSLNGKGAWVDQTAHHCFSKQLALTQDPLTVEGKFSPLTHTAVVDHEGIFCTQPWVRYQHGTCNGDNCGGHGGESSPLSYFRFEALNKITRINADGRDFQMGARLSTPTDCQRELAA